jgi:hypothetical protein
MKTNYFILELVDQKDGIIVIPPLKQTVSMVGGAMVESISRFASLVLVSSRYLGFLALVVGAIYWGTGTNTRRRRRGLGILCGGAGALVVYFALGTVYAVLGFIVAGSGPIPSTSQAMFAPGIRGTQVASQGAEQSLYQAADVLSKVAAIAGQALIAWGAALYAISPPTGRVSQSARTSLKTGVGLILGSMSGIILSFLPAVFPSLL